MAIALPITVGDKPVGTGFIAGAQGEMTAIVTSLHLLGNGQEFRIGIPPHLGDVSRPQLYPLPTIPAVIADFVLAEPMLDIAVLLCASRDLSGPVPRFIESQMEVQIGEPVLVVGYPFAAIGSFLETVEPSHISALGNRVLNDSMHRYELIISHQTYAGSSGSPVIKQSSGVVCGVIRGCLAPPSVISIGGLPLGTDTNVTYATSAHVIPSLVAEAFSTGVRKQ